MCVIMCHNAFNVWPKTTLLPVWPRDATRLDTPSKTSSLFSVVESVPRPISVLKGKMLVSTLMQGMCCQTLRKQLGKDAIKPLLGRHWEVGIFACSLFTESGGLIMLVLLHPLRNFFVCYNLWLVTASPVGSRCLNLYGSHKRWSTICVYSFQINFGKLVLLLE